MDPPLSYNVPMYRIALLERMVHDLLARVWSAFGLGGRFYLAPMTNLKGKNGASVGILFLCKGNICRSPYAEGKLRDEAARAGISYLAISSAGLDTGGGGPANPTAVSVAAGRQIDLRSHATSRCTRELVDEADLIIAMEPRHLRKLRALSADGRKKAILLGALLLSEGEKLTTPDPYGKSAEVFSDCFDKIDRAMKILIGRVAAENGKESRER